MDEALYIEFLHKSGHSQMDIVLGTLYYLGGEGSYDEVRNALTDAGYKNVRKLNLSLIASRANGCMAKMPSSLRVLDKGLDRLKEIGVISDEVRILEVATSLRAYLSDPKLSPDKRRFVEEAVKCFEAGCYRASIVLIWVGAFEVLKKHIFENYKLGFQREYRGHAEGDAKFKLTSVRKFSRIPEDMTLRIAEKADVFDRGVKDRLTHALGLRNTAGHPNEVELEKNVCAAQIEILVKNVFSVY